MCLYNSRISVNNILAGPKKIYGYKVLKKINNKLVSPYFKDYLWSVGENGADEKASKAVCKRIGRQIHHGIHVYVSKVEAYRCGPYGICVKVTCDKNDLIGANSYEMCFRKVRLSRKEYRAAMKKSIYQI